jgi:hypothetical protein
MSWPTAAALLAASASTLLAGGVQCCSSTTSSSALSLTSRFLWAGLMKPCGYVRYRTQHRLAQHIQAAQHGTACQHIKVDAQHSSVSI